MIEWPDQQSLAMKFLGCVLFVCLRAAWSQNAASPPLPELPDATVVAVFDDGFRFTMADFRKLFRVMPAQNQQMAQRDLKTFVEQYALMRKLTQMAEKQKLDQESPSQEALDYYRNVILSQAKMNDVLNNTRIDEAEITKAYETHKQDYKQVKVKALYVAFTTAAASQVRDGKKVPSEEEARVKAKALLAQARGGADFVHLVRENSDDQPSREKDGDFANLRPGDKIPDAIRTAVFALNEGEVSEPIEQSNGFYLLKADQITYRPLAELRDDISNQLKQDHFRQWMQQTHDSVKVEFPAPAFLDSGK